MTRTRALALCVVLAHFGAGAASAACNAPRAPNRVPDGATATEAEMVAAMTTLRRYDGDVNAYLKCLEFEMKRDRISDFERARLHNAAIGELQAIANRFNGEVRVYRARSKGGE